MITDNGKLSERFTQHTDHFNGTMTRSYENLNKNTIHRKINENSIKGSNQMNGGNINSLDNTVTGILIGYAQLLKDYVQAHGEVPVRNPVQLAVQATLLRAKDVATQASTLDITDEDALQNIENAEMGAQDINSPDEAYVLPQNAQAAIKIAMDYISDLHATAGGSGKMKDAIADMQRAAVALGNVTGSSNNLDGSDTSDISSWFSTTNDAPVPDATASTINTTLATIPSDTTINPVTSLPTITAPPPTTDTAGLTSLGNTSGVLSSLSSILGQVTSLAGGVTQAANSVTNASGSVKNALGSVGANSISTWLSQNSGMVIIILVVFVGLILLTIYMSRKK